MQQLNIYVLFLFVVGGLLCALTLRLFWKHGVLRHLPALVLGLVLSGAGGVFIALGLGLLDYQIVPEDKLLATVYFSKAGDDDYAVRIVTSGDGESSLMLRGEHWQMDARTLNGDRRLPFNIQPLARLENVYVYNRNPRTQSVEIQEIAVGQRRYAINVDTWQWLKEIPGLRSLLDFEVTRTIRNPIADKAVYRVSMSALGLVAERVPPASGKLGATN